MKKKIWCDSALLPGGWASNVLIGIDEDGNIESVEENVDSPSSQVDQEKVNGVLIPGIPNCHSHAHQRAMAGLGEKRGQQAGDSFWTWRKVMYHYLERIQPHHLFAIGRQLYLEMLKTGYTSVAEFQYLHHDPSGEPYSNPAEMTLECLEAANGVGIGFTALPVLYNYGGFGGQDTLDGQKRFLNDSEEFCAIVSALEERTSEDENCKTGIAPHSLRAVTKELLNEVLSSLADFDLAAIHLHIAEQTKEVDDCVEWSGRRPMEWLFEHFDVNEQWCLIHATHMTARETQMLAESQAVAGLCPTTEANLGDGFFNVQEYLEYKGRWAIGSDSHISISPVEELRWLEYGQRLLSRQRNIMTTPVMSNTGMALYQSAVAGGAQACGRRIGRIAEGYRADLVILNSSHPRLLGREQDDLIDSWIFSGNENPVQDVYVGGEQVIRQGRHRDEEVINKEYCQALEQLAE